MGLTLPRGFLTIGLTPGCPAGIGPEVWAKAIQELSTTLPKTTRLRWFASSALLLEGARRADIEAELEKNDQGDDVVVIGALRVEIAVKDADDRGANAKVRVVDDDALACQRDALLRACVAAARGDVHAIVTGPVRKAALVVNGKHYPGQTELVHHHLHDDDGPPLMVFAGAPFVLGLFTVHVALSAVPGLVQRDPLERAVRRLGEAARALLGVQRPHIVVLGVNPHAGEGGLFGDEEERVVKPLLRSLKEAGVDVDGPVPADGFFADVARHKKGTATMRGVHAVLAMHHDQGLAPYKLLCGGEGINITWGLRVPRTSPDHGTADAIAGTGKADASSTVAAVNTAVRLALTSPAGGAKGRG
jgi:4-hydroxythreonine-4-phosphate dehydrogenase